MKRLFLLMAPLFLASALWAAGQCRPHDTSVIESEMRCVDNGGIDIGSTSEDGQKVACMQNKEVRARCGPDGRLTQLRAYTDWFNKLKHYQDSCAAEGGTFAFQDSSFREPQNESYCLQAVPEVGSSMFEEPLCNYRSVCPAVTVVCERPCEDHTMARRY